MASAGGAEEGEPGAHCRYSVRSLWRISFPSVSNGHLQMRGFKFIAHSSTGCYRIM